MRLIVLIVVVAGLLWYGMMEYPDTMVKETVKQKCEAEMAITLGEGPSNINANDLCGCIANKSPAEYVLGDKLAHAYQDTELEFVSEGKTKFHDSTKQCITELYPNMDIVTK